MYPGPVPVEATSETLVKVQLMSTICSGIVLLGVLGSHLFVTLSHVIMSDSFFVIVLSKSVHCAIDCVTVSLIHLLVPVSYLKNWSFVGAVRVTSLKVAKLEPVASV